MDNNRTLVEARVKDTIGYSEAENKNSFMVGVSVAFSKTEEIFKLEIETLKRNYEYFKSAYENVLADMKVLTSTMDKYRDYE